MPNLLMRYATPLTSGLFAVSLISGVALFFHLGQAAFHGMHEWLSMVLILPFALHLWKNWRSFLTYFKRPPMAIATGLSLAAAIAFAIPAMTATGRTGGPPQLAALQAFGQANIETAAPWFGTDGEGLAKALRDSGYTVSGTQESLNDVAKASGKSGREIMGTLGGLMRP